MKRRIKREAGVEAAIVAAGGMSKLARLLGILPTSVDEWMRVPPSRVLQIERLTGLPRHEMRPDLYPKEELNA